jgi:hypothetical protein
MQTPQGVDAQHGGALFPVDELENAYSPSRGGRARLTGKVRWVVSSSGRVWIRCASP